MKKKLLVIAAAAAALIAASAGPQYVGCSPESAALRVCYRAAP